MDKKYVDSISKAWQEVYEKKTLDPVDHDELKGKHKDRDDKDIDNDGDVDSSDKFLHKKRKAISKAIKKEEVDESSCGSVNASKKVKKEDDQEMTVDEPMAKDGMKKCAECGGSTENHDEECSKYTSSEKSKASATKEGVRHEVHGYGEIITETDNGYDILFAHGVEFDVPAEQCESIRRAMDIAKKSGGAMTPAVKKMDKIKKGVSDNPRVKKALQKANEEDEVDEARDAKSKVQEGTVAELETEIEEVYSALQQRAIASMKNMWEFNEHPKSSGPDADHKKGATAPETMKDKRKGKAADDMANDHDADNPSIDDTEEKGHDDVSKAARAVKSQAPKRGGEERVGHLSPEMPVDTTKVGKGGL